MSQKPKQLIRQNLKLVQPHKKTQNTNVLGFFMVNQRFYTLIFSRLIRLYSGMMLNRR